MSANATSGAPKHRILSIDGGGILGTFPAAFLAQLERDLDRPIGSYFDLIAGTSTGGIIAIGLALGLRASEILQLYETRGPEIFGQSNGRLLNLLLDLVRAARRLYRPKYNSDSLRAALVDVFGKKRIGDAQTRLLIPAWNPVARTVYIYKTAHHPRLKTDYRELAIDAALATSAAPTYFPQHTTAHNVGLVDGGVWANNPTAIAVVEAITLLGWPRDSIHVLSLGCLEEVYALPRRAGFGNLGLKAIRLLMDGQSHGAMGIAKLLTGHEHERAAIHRIDHSVPYKVYEMDNTRVIGDLKGLGYAKAREKRPALEKIFFDSLAEKFEPFYRLHEAADQRPTMDPEISSSHFGS